jgi:hypothetical protein
VRSRGSTVRNKVNVTLSAAGQQPRSGALSKRSASQGPDVTIDHAFSWCLR